MSLPRRPVWPARGLRASITRKRAIAIVTGLALFAIVLVSARSPDPSAEPTVQQFLLAWEQGQYRAAAALTTGAPKTVIAELRTAYRQLDAANLVLGMHRISQHGGNGQAQFNASIDLGRSGAPWQYRGHFALRMVNSAWKVVWSPSVIYPGLRTGYRLAVVTTMPRRAALLDAAGRPLARRTPVYIAGVHPGRLASPQRTADKLADATNLDANQVYGDIVAAPSAQFFELARLRPSEYHRLASQLGRVPGLVIKQDRLRLFDTDAKPVAGSVGTETARVLRDDGVPYRPGATIGLSGLQLAYQRSLVGTPTTEVVAENAAGRQIAMLKSWPGSDGKPVRTTIDAAAQSAADHAVGSLPGSAAIVAVRASDGKILAVATHKAHRMPAVNALNGRYRPGQAFTIVSTAALVAAGFNVATRIPCMAQNQVGGRTFKNSPPETALGPEPPFNMDFARACGTAFAGLSLRLHPSQLTSAARRFGLGARWQPALPLRAFTGSLGSPASVSQLAAASIGAGTVRTSPLDMALTAATVQAGVWHPPTLVTSAADPRRSHSAAFSPQVVGALRSLMRGTVTSGDGRAAGVPGPAVYGQVGNVPLGQARRDLWASWFVGYRGNVAFAVLELTRSPLTSAAPVAGKFLRGLPANS
jgi:cell division protein FtsI/penicillin-binding protein 2